MGYGLHRKGLRDVVPVTMRGLSVQSITAWS